MEKSTGWTIETLRTYLDTRIEESDRRYEQRFISQQDALQKQEEAIERRFGAVNEFRESLADATKTYMPRMESNNRYDSVIVKIDDHCRQDVLLHTQLNDRMDAISHRLDLREGELLGSQTARTTTLTIVGILAVIAGAMMGHFLR